MLTVQVEDPKVVQAAITQEKIRNEQTEMARLKSRTEKGVALFSAALASASKSAVTMSLDVSEIQRETEMAKFKMDINEKYQEDPGDSTSHQLFASESSIQALVTRLAASGLV